jgi:cytochrome c-type biogenesis protein CcmH/NrfG
MDAPTLIREGNASANKKEWEQALEKYRTAAVLDPGNPQIHFLIGCCHHKMNHGPDARVAWQRVLDLDPTHEKAREWIYRVTGMRYTPEGRPSSVITELRGASL